MAGALQRVDCPGCGKFLCRTNDTSTVEVKCLRCGCLVLIAAGQATVQAAAAAAK
jgi:phage FluMu protein Com